MDPEAVKVLTTQLSILNERSRWYTARLWQIPFAFLGLFGAAIFSVLEQNILYLMIMLLFSGISGFLIILHMCGLAGRVRKIVEHMQAIEAVLRLDTTVGYFRTLTWPLFTILAAFSISCLAAFIYLIRPWL